MPKVPGGLDQQLSPAALFITVSDKHELGGLEIDGPVTAFVELSLNEQTRKLTNERYKTVLG